MLVVVTKVADVYKLTAMRIWCAFSVPGLL